MIYGIAFNPEARLSAKLGKTVVGGTNIVEWNGVSAGGTTNEIFDIIDLGGEKNTRIEFVGGITGERIKAALKDKNCVFCDKKSENTLKVSIFADKTTNYIGSLGREIADEQIVPLVERLRKIDEGELLIVAEKISGKVDPTAVKHVFSAVAPKSVRVLFRADEKNLAEVLKYSPYYLVTDEKTLSDYFEKKNMPENELVKAMSFLQKKGAQSVICFGSGRVLALGYMGGIYKADGAFSEEKSQNAFLAAFICSAERRMSFERCLKNGAASASGVEITRALTDEKAFTGTFTIIRRRVKKQVIRNVAHYLIENSGVSFKKKPITLLDLALLTQIAMLDINKLSGEKLSLREAKRKYVEKNPDGYVDLGVIVPQSFPVLSLCADSLRYKDVEIVDRKSLIDDEKVVQFTAITFLFPTGEYAVAFNGTDDTIVGWKEDFYLLYDEPTVSQNCAVEYLDALAASTPDDAKIYVVGHSKGGNLAMYGAVTAGDELHKKLVAAYNFDGPGFVENFYKSKKFLAVQDKITSVIPQLSVVGRLFNHEEKVMIVKSCFAGIYQHDLYSWETEGDNFVTVPHLDELSDKVQAKVNEIMYTLTPEQRKIFVDGLFSLLYSTDSFTLTQLMRNRGKLFGNFFKCNAATRRILLSMMTKLMSDRYVREMVMISMREARKMQDKKEFEESSIVSGNIDKAIESIGVIVDRDTASKQK